MLRCSIGQYGKVCANETVRRLAEKHRKQLTHFSKSPKNTNLLLELQKQTAARALKPLQDVVTRWTSTAAS